MSERERLASLLPLQDHPEGGRFAESLRTTANVQVITDPEQYDGPRSAMTAIYFLLDRGASLSWHIIPSTEMLFYHAGDGMIVHLLHADGKLEKKVLGNPLNKSDAQFQVVIPRNTWYAMELGGVADWCLYGEVIAPGWEAKDWRAGKKEDLIKLFPQHTQLFERLCKT